MKTCPNCGIRFENKDGRCPLCERDGGEIELRKAVAFTKVFYWRLYSIFSLVAFMIILVIDLVYTSGLSWSKIPLISILYIWITLFLNLKIRLKSFTPIFLQAAATIIMLAFMDRFTPGKPWFIELALPVLIGLGVLLNLSLLVGKFTHPSLLQTTAINIIIAGIFLILLELLIKNYKQETSGISWSLIAFVCLLPLSLFFIYFDKKIKKNGEELKKYFHF